MSRPLVSFLRYYAWMLHICIYLFFASLFLPKYSVAAIPGAVPLSFKSRPATDLVYEGKRLTSENAARLHLENGFDISKLNPGEKSDIWRDQTGLKIEEKDFIKDENALFVGTAPSRIGIFRFKVRKTDNIGNQFDYSVRLSKNIHTFLLRKNILIKMGYKVPIAQYKRKLKVEFKGKISQRKFVKDLEGQTFADSKRWIIENNEDENYLILQDIIILPSQSQIYNLATGFLSAEVINGRRIFNSLLIPYALTYVKESANALSWDLGRIFNENFIFDFPDSEEFSTTYHDMLWSARRIAKLKRSDFREIVKKSYYPKAIELLLIEKLIERRNSLLKKLNLPYKRIKSDVNISLGKDLKNGVILKEDWKGYSSRFTYGPIESPLNQTELKSYFKSRVLSFILDNISSQISTKLLDFGENIQERTLKEQQSAAVKQLINFFKTGKLTKVPLQKWSIPTFKGGVNVSRDIIAGDYAGTSNMIQLADSIGFRVQAGIFVGTLGIPTPAQLNGAANVQFSRNYTHLKPINSITKALKEPFKNLLIKSYKKKQGSLFDIIATSKFKKYSNEKKKEVLLEQLEKFDKSFDKNESLLISDTINLSGGANFSISLSPEILTRVGAGAYKILLSRIHILKKDEKTIHIYRDKANANAFNISTGVNSYIPLVSFNSNHQKGLLQTKFYSLNLDKDQEVSELLKNVSALREVMLGHSLEYLNTLQKPYQLKNNFKESTADFSFLFYKRMYLNRLGKLKITHPKGESRTYYMREIGHREGNDGLALGLDVLNYSLSRLLSQKILVNNPGSGDPGNSFKGHSFKRKGFTEVANEGSPSPYAEVQYTWRGWSATKKKISGIIKKVNKKYGKEIFSKLSFHQTEKVELYNLTINLFIYEKAINHILAMPERKVRGILNRYLKFPMNKVRGGRSARRNERNRQNIKKRNFIKRFFKVRKKYKGNIKRRRDLIDNLTLLINMSEERLPFKAFLKLVGGKKNIFIQGTIRGFRAGDENGDQPIYSSSLGKFGQKRVRGNLNALKTKFGLTEGEFFGYWFLRRL